MFLSSDKIEKCQDVRNWHSSDKESTYWPDFLEDVGTALENVIYYSLIY